MWHRNRVAAATVVAVSALAAASALAGCGTRIDGAAGAPDRAARMAAAEPSSPAAGASAPAQHTSQSPAMPAEPPLRAGQVGTLAQVPWAQVGPGWALADYTTGSTQLARPVTLYMLDPEGGMYQIYRWPATTQPWLLLSWSGDKRRVLLAQRGTGPLTLHELTIATGHISTFTLPADVTRVLGYTRPNGRNILADQNGVVRYSLSGAFQARLSAGSQFDSAVITPDGTAEVVSGGSGVEKVSNAGGTVRFLPIPGAGSCGPVRWWNSADVLVSCMPDQVSAPDQVFAPRLWLVPVSGAAPTALTPQRTGGGPDFGDVDAWQLPTGLYLQALAPCGPPYIAKQSASGAVQVVTVPGSYGNGVVVATSGSRLLVQEYAECEQSSTLVWFDPATSGVQNVLTAMHNSTGVASVIPFSGDGEQPPPQG